MSPDPSWMLDYRMEPSRIAKLRSTLVVGHRCPDIHTRQPQRVNTMDRRTT